MEVAVHTLKANHFQVLTQIEKIFESYYESYQRKVSECLQYSNSDVYDQHVCELSELYRKTQELRNCIYVLKFLSNPT